MKTQTKLTFSASNYFNIKENITLHQVIKYYPEDDSYDLTNGDYIQSCRDGRYYNKMGDRYEMLSLSVFDTETNDIQETQFLGFVKMFDLE